METNGSYENAHALSALGYPVVGSPATQPGVGPSSTLDNKGAGNDGAVGIDESEGEALEEPEPSTAIRTGVHTGDDELEDLALLICPLDRVDEAS